MKYCLCTTGISDIWDLGGELLLLGPWCITDEGNRNLVSGRAYSFVPSCWRPAAKTKEAADYCLGLYQKLMPQLSESLNSLHACSYPVKYWQVLLGNWLLHFTEAVYERYRRIENAIGVSPDFYTQVLPRGKCHPACFNTHDFFNKVNQDYYNLKIFSLIIYQLCPGRIVKENEPKAEINKQIAGYGQKISFLNKLQNFPGLYSRPSIIFSDMYQLGRFDKLLLKFKLGFGILKFLDFWSIKEDSLGENYDPSLRGRITLRQGASDKFFAFLYKIIPESIPMCYVENYKFYKQKIRGFKNSLASTKIVGSTTGWMVNEGLKFFAAEAVLGGAKLIEFQHGGGFGTSYSMPNEALCLEKDIFYTWGWASEENKNVLALPSHRLSKLRDRHSGKLDKILFIGTATPRYINRLCAYLLPEDMPKYFEDKKLFFQALPKGLRAKVLYRPYMHEYGWQEARLVREACPDAKFASGENLFKLMKKAKLAVIDHAHTSFIEALAMNVPSVLYWDHNVYLMRPQAEPYFKMLREAKILFQSPADAAKKVEEIFDDPLGWWNEAGVQRARSEFCRRYAFASKDYTGAWAKELKRITN